MPLDICLLFAILACVYVLSTIESLSIQNPGTPRDTRYRVPSFKNIPQTRYTPYYMIDDVCDTVKTHVPQRVVVDRLQNISTYGYTPNRYLDETRFIRVEDTKEPLPVSPDFFMYL